MIINLIFSIFTVVVAKANETTDYHLSPTSPPIVFLAQYYTLKPESNKTFESCLQL